MGTPKKGMNSKIVLPNPEFFDEIPLWSAPFGLTLLQKVKYTPGMQILDIGCGTGFPLIEIAAAAGNKSKVFGVDPWEEALTRAKQKANLQGLNNVRFLDCSAEELPFANNFFNLVVSNNGLNNVNDIQKVLAEINRVSCMSTQLVFTANLPDTFSLFYKELKTELRKSERFDLVKKINQHIRQKRFSVKKWNNILIKHGFSVKETTLSSFDWRFADTEAFLNHPFIVTAFKPSWNEIIPEKIMSPLLKNVASKLNARNKNIIMKIPFVCMDCRKTAEL
jgi:arsenite methyltransferase